MWFKAYHEHGHGGTVDASNYIAAINPETCIGCGLCVKRCPMEAIELQASDEAQNKVTQVLSQPALDEPAYGPGSATQSTRCQSTGTSGIEECISNLCLRAS